MATPALSSRPVLARSVSTVPSMGQTALRMAPGQPPLEQKSREPSTQPSQQQQASVPATAAVATTAGAACINCKMYGPKCFTHGKKLMGSRRGNVSSDSGKYTGHWSLQERIRATNADHVRVKRAYRSTQALFVNTTATSQDSLAFSLEMRYEAGQDTLSAHVMGGGPIVGTDTNVTFNELSEEVCWLMKTFRYIRVNKFQMTAIRSIQTVSMPTMVEGDGTIVQVGMQGNALDPGRILLRPWAGQPAVANYTNGVLTENEWTDNFRKKLKKTSSPVSNGGVQQTLEMCLTPVIPFEVINEDTSVGDAVVQYIRSPTCDWAEIATGITNLNGYGFIFYWYHPGLFPAATGVYKIPIYWDLELEFFGLKRAEGLPGVISQQEQKDEESGVVFADSKEALAAALAGQKLPGLVDRAAYEAVKRGPDPPITVLNSQPDIEAEKTREKLSVVEDYVQVSKRPSTPRK